MKRLTPQMVIELDDDCSKLYHRINVIANKQPDDICGQLYEIATDVRNLTRIFLQEAREEQDDKTQGQ